MRPSLPHRVLLSLTACLGLGACTVVSTAPATTTPGPVTPGPGPSDAVMLQGSVQTLRGQIGKAFYVDCMQPFSGSVWGTDVYTDDSSPCVAAVHAGVLAPGQSGRILGFIAPGLPSYSGSQRNGVSTSDYGEWAGSFQFRPYDGTAPAPGTINWSTNATEYRGSPGLTLRVTCPANGSIEHRVWGSNPYTDDSSICVAAVHAGLVTPQQGGSFTLQMTGGYTSYPGSQRNGVSTSDYGEWPGSFTLTP